MEMPLEKVFVKSKSKYKLVILAARRALELSEGSPKLVEGDPKKKPSVIALEEIAQGKVSLKERKEKTKRKSISE